MAMVVRMWKNVRKWVPRAKSCCAGEMSVLVEDRSRRPVTVTRDENQRGLGTMIQENRRINLLKPNVNYSGRTAPLTSKVTFYIFIQQI